VRALLASPLGFRIGLVLGSLGGGGSIIAVRSLVPRSWCSRWPWSLRTFRPSS